MAASKHCALDIEAANVVWLELKGESLRISQLNQSQVTFELAVDAYKLRCAVLDMSRSARGLMEGSPAPDDSSRPSASAADEDDEDGRGEVAMAVGKLVSD